jgi:ferredoxin
MKILIDLDACAGHGQCEDAAPDVFTVNDQGLVVVLNDNPSEDQRAEIEDAARRCPADVISIEG